MPDSLLVCITIDMEHDCPPYLSTYRGMEEGTPKLLALFQRENIPATFFLTGDVARRYPEIVRDMVNAGHEIGCHGDTHRKFTTMTHQEAEGEIARSTETLRHFSSVVSFRAPNLLFPPAFLGILKQRGYELDSSEGKHKSLKAFTSGIRQEDGLLRVPASTTSSVLRLPRQLREGLLNRLRTPIVLFVHPWEFVDMRREKLRFDCRWGTGDDAVTCLEETIRYFKHRQAKFLRMRENEIKPHRTL